MEWMNDALVLTLVLLALSVWAWLGFRRWLQRPPEIRSPYAADGKRPEGEVPELLREQGYEPIHGKRKVDMNVYVDGNPLGSSLFVDYFAKRDGKVYAVKLAKGRKPVDVSAGSSVREHLLVYALLYEDTAGVLYVDANLRRIYKISFELEL